MKELVGIVLVSHSPRLAEGLADLVAQIASGSVPVVTAAGDDHGGIGTSYAKVHEAILKADRGAGVVILPDLGSSVLTARAVLADHPLPMILLIDAPFVEGAVAAVVTASTEADLHTVAAAAREARDVPKL